MKKILLSILLASILFFPIASANEIISNDPEKSSSTMDEFTHRVFVEYGTMTTCGPCVTASSQLYSIYNSGDLDFQYVSLVADVGITNVIARLNELGITSVPDVYFDGDYKHILGSQSSEVPYRNAITQAGERSVPDIDVQVTVEWIGGGTLKLDVTVINNEPERFTGQVRTFIVEKESRWNDFSGSPYHYAVLDIPIDKAITVVNAVPKADTYTFSKTWFGNIHGFGDIEQDNIVVYTSVYEKDSKEAIQTASAEPVIGKNFVIKQIFYQMFSRLVNIYPNFEKLLNL